LGSIPRERQTALFSATLPPRILAIAKRHLRDAVRVTIASEKTAPGAAPRVRESVYVVQRRHKVAALARVLDMESPTSAIVFCRTRTEVDELSETLNARGYNAEALHGGLSQEQRDRVMRRFRDGVSDVLVATDVAARGLDIEHVSHVVNFDVPSSPDAYVHRIGRTGRAGREGVAITLAEAREQRLLRNIELLTKRKMRVETVPTVHDLRARRLQVISTAMEEALASDGLDRYRTVVEALAQEFDVLDIAAAAVKVADESGEGAPANDEQDIPTVPVFEPRPERERPARSNARAPQQRARPEGGPVARIYVGLGRLGGVRPGDLVGAIANEANLTSADIGAIEIADRFSLVEIPEPAAERVIKALRNTSIRGKKIIVRLDRGR
ncbi:MAG: ATP-independent helicase, partial [Candidatus Eremiobacteraeota bacterium]|nr:ATP-independent helicase [Candidatus Eremiobacteraeota bacterium]